MTTIFFYLFLYSSWGVGIISWISFISKILDSKELENKEKALELQQKLAFLGKTFPLPTTSVNKELPQKLKELISSSPQHPEVEEINSDDEIIGVRFEAKNYPPTFDGYDEDDE